jgi:hypothetical protein
MIAETRVPIPASPGQPERHDHEYRRCGMCNNFIACESLAGNRMAKVTERKTRQDWAYFLEDIANQYETAEKITIVMSTNDKKEYTKTGLPIVSKHWHQERARSPNQGRKETGNGVAFAKEEARIAQDQNAKRMGKGK